jgi:hypothetical protein
MNEEDLSPEAQQRLKELTPSIDSVENWNIAYRDLLKGLAEEKLPPLADVEIKGQGLEAFRRSHKEYAVAVELQAYAAAFLGTDSSAAVAKLPESTNLDVLLASAMPNTGQEVRRVRFKSFLMTDAESRVDEQMELHPKPRVSREEYVKQMAERDFETLDQDNLSAETQHEYTDRFRDWWRRHDGNNLSRANEKKGLNGAERRKELVRLLPSRPDKPGFTKKKWREKADNEGHFLSIRTFDRDVQALVDSKAVHVQIKDGTYRQLPK